MSGWKRWNERQGRNCEEWKRTTLEHGVSFHLLVSAPCPRMNNGTYIYHGLLPLKNFLLLCGVLLLPLLLILPLVLLVAAPVTATAPMENRPHTQQQQHRQQQQRRYPSGPNNNYSHPFFKEKIRSINWNEKIG